MNFAVVEDSRSQAEVLKALLKSEGHQVEVFAEGLACLEALKSSSFDFYIIDWTLPDIGGDEVLKYIRENFGWDVPVVFCTASTTEENAADILRLGADDFIPKPIRYMEFMARIESLLRRRRPRPGWTAYDLRSARRSTAEPLALMSGPRWWRFPPSRQNLRSSTIASSRPLPPGRTSSMPCPTSATGTMRSACPPPALAPPKPSLRRRLRSAISSKPALRLRLRSPPPGPRASRPARPMPLGLTSRSTVPCLSAPGAPLGRWRRKCKRVAVPRVT